MKVCGAGSCKQQHLEELREKLHVGKLIKNQNSLTDQHSPVPSFFRDSERSAGGLQRN